MKKIFSCAALALLLFAPLQAQVELEALLADVERNNVELRALRSECEAGKLENRAGLNWSDPEVEAAYLWGSPRTVSNRVDLSVTQSVDLATLFGIRRRVARGRDRLADLRYQQQRAELLLEAHRCYLQLVYQNALCEALAARAMAADSLAMSYRRGFEQGGDNRLSLNRVELDLADARAELARARMERDALGQQLALMNGGVAVEVTRTRFEPAQLEGSCDEWVQMARSRSPWLATVQGEAQLCRSDTKLARAAALPSLSVGYTSETVADESYRGASVGLSIPLWGNRHRVRQSRAAQRAADDHLAQAELELAATLATLYRRAQSLEAVAADYRRALCRFGSLPLLQRALQAGQLSLSDYLSARQDYYEAMGRSLAAELDFRLALAQLSAVVR